MKQPGFVTLVIEDASGKRIRNLVSETRFPAGENTVAWDGLDDLGRDPDAAAHAKYHIPGQFVPPGTYRVRGLARPPLDLRYGMTPYHEGNPPWQTADKSSEWLSNHTPPSAIQFVPAGTAPRRAGKPASAGGQILVGSFVSEGGSGLAWLDTNGRKLWGQGWIGGVWTGASHLTRDEGDSPVPGVYAYTGSAWENELRLYELRKEPGKAPGDKRMGSGDDQPVLVPKWLFPHAKGGAWNQPGDNVALSGLAAHNGLIAASLPKLGAVLFVDGKARRALGTVPLPDPRGLAFDAQGRLLALSGKRLLRYHLPNDLSPYVRAGDSPGETPPRPLPEPEILIAIGLDDPQQIAVSKSGDIYLSDRGKSHQVKAFDSEGHFRRAIGHLGSPHAGPYDSSHMNNPNGLTLDDRGRLWVAEEDFQPKRVSVWDAKTGHLLHAFYGPQRYGGGGELDPYDPTASTFYYDGMKLHLDWKTGKSWPIEVFYRPGPNDLPAPDAYGADGPPQTPFRVNGRHYLTNAYNSNPTNGASIAMVWRIENGVARPVAAMGGANDWSLFAGFFHPEKMTALSFRGNALSALRKRLPADAKPADRVAFLWSDSNGDARIQPEELTFVKGESGGVTVMPDLSFVVSRLNDRAMQYKPTGFSAQGVPRYDFQRGIVLKRGVNGPASSGGDQALLANDGWVIHTNAPKPFAAEGLGGSFHGQAKWSYPSLWPGLHASHISPLPEEPGEVIGTTRLPGRTVTPRGSDAGELWAINGNKGNVYLFTTDGLFVATLFKDSRQAAWSFPQAKPGMSVNAGSAGEESFWPFLMQTANGAIWLSVNGSLIRVDGLENIRRLPPQTITVTPAALQSARRSFIKKEAQRQKAHQTGPLVVGMRSAPPVVDGKLDDWAGAFWVTVDTRMQQEGDWGRREVKTDAALAVSGDRLYAAFRTDDPNLLNNSGDNLQNLFKTGGALDLMVGTNPDADPKRNQAVAGDKRLLVTRVNGKTTAILYRPVEPGTSTEPVAFASPLRTLKFDRVDDVSSQVTLSGGPERTYEFSVPLATLGLQPQLEKGLRGDVGILRGNGFRTLQRAYWSNKATGLMSDVPSEAELTPQLWGEWVYKAMP